jgi:hypothetical protein
MFIIKNKLVFIHFPKTAGTAIKRRNGSKASIVNYRHAGIQQLPKIFRKFPIIGMIRNPFDFYVSLYYYFRNNKNKWKGYKHLFLQYCVDDEHIDLNGDFNMVKRDFEKHLRIWLTKGDEHEVNIDNYQTGLISRLHQEMYDSSVNVFKFEDIDSLNDFLTSHELSPLGCNHINNTNHRHYREYYSNELVKLVEQYDSMLLAKYDYHF